MDKLQLTNMSISELLDVLKTYNRESSELVEYKIDQILSLIFRFVETKDNHNYDLQIIQELDKCVFGVEENIEMKNKILQHFSNYEKDIHAK